MRKSTAGLAPAVFVFWRPSVGPGVLRLAGFDLLLGLFDRLAVAGLGLRAAFLRRADEAARIGRRIACGERVFHLLVDRAGPAVGQAVLLPFGCHGVSLPSGAERKR